MRLEGCRLKWKRICEGEEVLRVNQLGELVYLTFPALEEQAWFAHCFSTRMGGVSQGIYASMNFREDAEDTEEHVRENYRRIAAVLGMDVGRFVRSRLVHGNRIHLVTAEDYGEGTVRPAALCGYDGLMTDQPGVTLVATFADCVPIYFADPVHRAVALSHSGWRGTVAQIGRETLKAMGEVFGTRAEEVLVGIGPCICGDCYEVGEEVILEFQKEMDLEGIVREKGNGKYQLDLRKANQKILLQNGVEKEHLFTADICTCCNSEYLFSHRATQGKRGNLGAFLGIRE